jgi:hypothetical protein
MRKRLARIAALSATLLSALPSFAVGAKADSIVIVADTRQFSGVRGWWANLYNESHLLFALVTILILPLTGLVLGKITGAMVARLGVNLSSRDLAEH